MYWSPTSLNFRHLFDMYSPPRIAINDIPLFLFSLSPLASSLRHALRHPIISLEAPDNRQFVHPYRRNSWISGLPRFNVKEVPNLRLRFPSAPPRVEESSFPIGTSFCPRGFEDARRLNLHSFAIKYTFPHLRWIQDGSVWLFSMGQGCHASRFELSLYFLQRMSDLLYQNQRRTALCLCVPDVKVHMFQKEWAHTQCYNPTLRLRPLKTGSLRCRDSFYWKTTFNVVSLVWQ